MRISYLISAAILPSMLFGLGAYLLYGILLSTCFARLRRLHPDVWNALSQPTARKGNGPVVWTARKYLMSEEFHALGDDVLHRRARLAYILGIVGSTLFAVPIIVGLTMKLLIH
jgi:hypothetical protein